jgi:AcrR family transcriptional regulator
VPLAGAYELSGRTAQKQRTRGALLASARGLLREGTTPTVERAAQAASISRATAFRYFPNQRELLVALVPEVDSPAFIRQWASSDPGARLDAVAEALTSQLMVREPELRAALQLSMDGDAGSADAVALRGRRIAWIADALAPLAERLPQDELDRVVHAIGATLGIEAFVWLIDVAGLSQQQAVATMRWSARALLRVALE